VIIHQLAGNKKPSIADINKNYKKIPEGSGRTSGI
jgi:hypothetical protein